MVTKSHCYRHLPEADMNFQERYDRQIKLPELGEQGQQKLKNARVLIVGVGGLGCPSAQYLVAAGIGHLGLMDGDRLDVSNLHRQILFTEKHVGQSKATAAREELLARNSQIEITAYDDHLTEKNAEQIFSKYDIIVDGTDNFQTKYLINDACILTNKPFIGASIYKYQGQISVFNFMNGPTYRCFYPTYKWEDNRNCEETGVLGVLPGILGVMQATEVLKMILGIGEVLSGKMKIIDALHFTDQLISFPRNQDQIDLVKNRPLQAILIKCSLSDSSKTYLDIRESFEQPRVEKKSVINIPLSQLTDRIKEIPRETEVHVFCQSGMRSKKAVELLTSEHGFSNLVDAGGIENIIK